jgi:hypothetical protein
VTGRYLNRSAEFGSVLELVRADRTAQELSNGQRALLKGPAACGWHTGLANRCETHMKMVTIAARQGANRVRSQRSLLLGFLRHTGCNSDRPVNLLGETLKSGSSAVGVATLLHPCLYNSRSEGSFDSSAYAGRKALPRGTSAGPHHRAYALFVGQPHIHSIWPTHPGILVGRAVLGITRLCQVGMGHCKFGVR